MIANLAKLFLIVSFFGIAYIVLTKIKVLVTMPDIFCKGENKIKKTIFTVKKTISESETLKNLTFEKVLRNLLFKIRGLILKIEKKISSKLYELGKKNEVKKERKEYWEKLKKITKKK